MKQPILTNCDAKCYVCMTRYWCPVSGYNIRNYDGRGNKRGN